MIQCGGRKEEKKESKAILTLNWGRGADASLEEEEVENMAAVRVPVPDAHGEMCRRGLDSGNKT